MGQYLGFTGGVFITRGYKLYFWELEATNTIGITSDRNRWWFLRLEPTATEATTGLSYRTLPSGAHPPAEGLSPPSAGDVVSISNYPDLPTQFSLRLKVADDTVREFLKTGKKVGKGIEPFADMHRGSDEPGEYGCFGPRTQSRIQALSDGQANNRFSQEPVEAQGVFVTKDYHIYFWRLACDYALYLTDGKEDCVLESNSQDR